jgi:hypothetical protein
MKEYYGMREKIPIMKLGIVKEIVEATGMGISYAYEDLVFLDHNALLLQFTQDSDTVLVHTNREAATEPAEATIAALQQAAQEREMTFLAGQVYALIQGEDEQIKIEFTH